MKFYYFKFTNLIKTKLLHVLNLLVIRIKVLTTKKPLSITERLLISQEDVNTLCFYPDQSFKNFTLSKIFCVIFCPCVLPASQNMTRMNSCIYPGHTDLFYHITKGTIRLWRHIQKIISVVGKSIILIPSVITRAYFQ